MTALAGQVRASSLNDIGETTAAYLWKAEISKEWSNAES